MKTTKHQAVLGLVSLSALVASLVGAFELGSSGASRLSTREARGSTPTSSASTELSPARDSTAVPRGPEGFADANIFTRLAKRALPSVVNISTLSTVKTAYSRGPGLSPGLPPGFPPGFEDFFGFPPAERAPRRLPKAAALGSGFVIDAKGIIMTNNHVVADADEIKVQFTENPDETPTEGKVIGRDPDLDVALIQVKPPRALTALPLGDSEALEVGEYVMAVGNPFGNGHSVSHGIVSAKGRLSPGAPVASWLQIDAPINPGNSGGPLLNLQGEVVGINNAIDARAQGIGFAIPINYVKSVLAQLETDGKVKRGYIGAVVGMLTEPIAEKVGAPRNLRAPIVTEVSPDSPAQKAGLKPYDVITEVGAKSVHTPNEVVLAITSVPVGQSVDLKILREGREKKLEIRTAPRPGREVAEN